MAKKMYCSVCKKQLKNPKLVVCDGCGKPTTPVTAAQLRERAYLLTKNQKKLLRKQASAYITVGLCGTALIGLLLFPWIVISSLIHISLWIALLIWVVPLAIFVYMLVIGVAFDRNRLWAIRHYAMTNPLYRHMRPTMTMQFADMLYRMESAESFEFEQEKNAEYQETLKTKWFCEACGYANEKSALECKSCGKYRRM